MAAAAAPRIVLGVPQPPGLQPEVVSGSAWVDADIVHVLTPGAALSITPGGNDYDLQCEIQFAALRGPAVVTVMPSTFTDDIMLAG
jgi:hypothetical protein